MFSRIYSESVVSVFIYESSVSYRFRIFRNKAKIQNIVQLKKNKQTTKLWNILIILVFRKPYLVFYLFLPSFQLHHPFNSFPNQKKIIK